MHKQNWMQRAAMKIGARMVKSAGGVTFDTVNAEWYARNGYPQIYAMLSGGLPAWSGESVNIPSALNHSVVYACYKVISESIGFLPAELHRKTSSGNVELAEKHPMYSAMNYAPNDEITAQSFMETMTGHCVMGGNAFAQITRRSGTGVAQNLYLIHPDSVLVQRDKAKRLVYVVKETGAPDKTYTVEKGKPHDILHIRGLGWDGMVGYSVITMARQSIGGAIAAEKNVARFWANGGRKPYVLKLQQKFKSDEDFKKFRADWESVYSEPNKVPILEPWLEYVPEVGMSMKDAQMLETRQFSIPEICRWFSVQPHMVGDLSRATFSNIEELFLQFKQTTLQTWLVRWESEFWRCVLTDDEKSQGYFLRHNVDELLRGAFQTRMNGYATALQNGYMNIDEVRGMEGRNKLPGGAGANHHIQLNMQDVEKIGEEPAEAKPTKTGIRRVQ